MKEYDFLFIQNAPAFYKINLFNALASHCRIGVVFLGESKQVVMNVDSRQWKFDSYFMGKRDLDKTNLFETISFALKLWKLVRSIKYRYIVYGGWSNAEFMVLMFLTSKNHNCVISESCIYESSATGIKGLIKRLVLNRNSQAFVSGVPHKDLLLKLKYKGVIHITGGVGLVLRNFTQNHQEVFHGTQSLRYVFTGRLIEKKNVNMLIDAFNQNGRPLSILGTGENEENYKAKANPNITFLGFVENNKLHDIYAECDCFILPSNVEQWGLVVEEALYNGLPVIVSDMVGCNIDMVRDYDAGVVFEHQSIDSLQDAIEQMEHNYQYYQNNVMAIDWEKRDREQLEAFTDILQV